MEYLSWDLQVLARAIAFTNLSAASAHVGLSQPQLSRIVAKLEEQLGLTLLDRETRRKSSWTAAAYRLVEIYSKTFHDFRTEVHALATGLTPHELHVGTLEGLVPEALAFCRRVLEETKVMMVQLDVLDTSFLEEGFAKGELDIIFTAKAGGTGTFRQSHVLGYQSVVLTGGSKASVSVRSAFEYASTAHKGPATEKTFVSNSLSVRREWIDHIGGIGTLPSEVRPHREQKDDLTVVVLAHDSVPARFWEDVARFLK